MKCPRDGSSLARVSVGAIAVDKCHTCDGIWLDYGELKQLRSSGRRNVEEQLEVRYGNPETEQGEVEGYMRCPACNDVGLVSHHVSYFKPVKIDQCPSCHGMWLDDGELDTLNGHCCPHIPPHRFGPVSTIYRGSSCTSLVYGVPCVRPSS